MKLPEKSWLKLNNPMVDGETEWKVRFSEDIQVWWHDHEVPETHADYPYYIVRDTESEHYICTYKGPNFGIDAMLEDPKIIAGPYATLDVVKVAWLMLFGR